MLKFIKRNKIDGNYSLFFIHWLVLTLVWYMCFSMDDIGSISGSLSLFLSLFLSLSLPLCTMNTQLYWYDLQLPLPWDQQRNDDFLRIISLLYTLNCDSGLAWIQIGVWIFKEIIEQLMTISDHFA